MSQCTRLFNYLNEEYPDCEISIADLQEFENLIDAFSAVDQALLDFRERICDDVEVFRDFSDAILDEYDNTAPLCFSDGFFMFAVNSCISFSLRRGGYDGASWRDDEELVASVRDFLF